MALRLPVGRVTESGAVGALPVDSIHCNTDAIMICTLLTHPHTLACIAHSSHQPGTHTLMPVCMCVHCVCCTVVSLPQHSHRAQSATSL